MTYLEVIPYHDLSNLVLLLHGDVHGITHLDVKVIHNR